MVSFSTESPASMRKQNGSRWSFSWPPRKNQSFWRKFSHPTSMEELIHGSIRHQRVLENEFNSKRRKGGPNILRKTRWGWGSPKISRYISTRGRGPLKNLTMGGGKALLISASYVICLSSLKEQSVVTYINKSLHCIVPRYSVALAPPP